MKRFLTLGLCLATLCSCGGSSSPTATAVKNDLRAPAFPLITIDPNTSAWSTSDNLYDTQVTHWTGKEFPFIGAIRVDGKVYRFMGKEIAPLKAIAPTTNDAPWSGKYLMKKPAQGWEKSTFNDVKWTLGEAPYGADYPNIKTKWSGDNTDLWVRRTVTLDKDLTGQKVYIKYSHDDAFELYVNGAKVIDTGLNWQQDQMILLPDSVVATLKAGKNIIASHTHNTTGGALTDFGLYTEDDNIPTYLNTAATQKSVDVQAMQTKYVFDCGNVELNLTFTAPLFLDDLDLLSRPINYVSYKIISLDGKAHDSQIYFEAAPNWALDVPSQASKADGYAKDGLNYVRTGSVAQKILNASGDDKRIDWGHFYMVADSKNASTNVGDVFAMRSDFAKAGKLGNDVASKDNASLAIAQDLGSSQSVSGKVMLGYDDVYSIQYFKENLRPYWNRKGDKTIEQEFVAANNDYADLFQKCASFDNKLMTDAAEVGGQKYADLCALAYRQSISAHKLVQDSSGNLLFLSKENFSNGCINTVDVTYPSAPLFLIYNPKLMEGMLNGIFYFSESGKWTKSFPAHDLGQYPLANGQVYGGDGMPVEEGGNMLTLCAGIAAAEGNAKYAEKHWDTLTKWTDYLVENGGDPENQLCTDDFAGHFAHNVNLSVKAIMGVASYAYMADMLGKKDVAAKYTAKAKEMAAKCAEMAADGDHYSLTFDRKGTWSQKYNLVWDKVLNMNIFPKDFAQKEIAYYLTKQNKYGLPLDSRKNYTKSDWIIWTATLANDKATFEKFINPEYDFYNATTDRVPMSDWYNTDNKTKVGFQARSVVGGYYMKMWDHKLNKR